MKTGKEGLNYMLTQFDLKQASGAKGITMVNLCIDLLGNQYNSSNSNWSTPEEWYDSLLIAEQSILPSYEHDPKDKIELLAYLAPLQQYTNTKKTNTVTIVAPKISSSTESESEIPIYATVYSIDYELLGDTLYTINGTTFPVKITYEKNGTQYKLKEYTQAKEGGQFIPSIQEFSNHDAQLVENIIYDYENREALFTLMKENVKEYVIKNKIPANYYENEKGEKINLF